LQQTVTCSNCGSEAAPDAHFCQSCGNELTSRCPNCSAPRRTEDRFCPNCGHQFADDPTREDRKLVTVLFADLQESTRLGEQLDPERLKALLTEYFQAMAVVIEKWEGTVEKYIGDAVVAIFGVPTTHADDPERAVHSAIEMQARLEELSDSVTERFGVQLAMRIGISTGDVLASADGRAAMAGDVFNVAARLQDLAEPGGVVVSDRTYRASRRTFEYHSLGEQRLKGKTEQVQVWALSVARSVPVQAPTLASEMVGRDAELAMLDAVLHQAIDGERPRLVIVSGDTGVGKSRLVAEFVARQDGGTRVLTGRCLAYGEGNTYWPLREIIWGFGDLTLADTATEAARKLKEQLSSFAQSTLPDPDGVGFALAATAGIRLPDNPIAKLSPESAGEELALAWPAFTTALAQDRPTVLVIEDVHWADPQLLDMVERLVVRSTGALLVVTTARPEFFDHMAGWSARTGPTQISLQPLSAGDLERLAEQLLPGLGSAERHRLLESASGNPFFAEEIVRHLLDEGLLRRTDDGLVAAAEALSPVLPDTVRALLAARIDSLEPSVRAILQAASVVGDVFWPGPLEVIEGGEVGTSLAVLEREGFVVAAHSSSLPGQREMSFRHGLMCETAYKSISRARLPRLHAEVAAWTEQMVAGRRDEFIDVIAHHYEAAAQPADAQLAWPNEERALESVRAAAVGALVEAGLVARRRFSISQAAGYADRALVLARGNEERLRALELKASSYHAAARVDEAWPVYVEAITVARELGDPAALSRVVAQSTLLWTRYAGAFTGEDWKPQAEGIIQDRLANIDLETEDFETAAVLLGRSTANRRGVFEWAADKARADAERAVAIAEKLGSDELLSHALDSLEMHVRTQGLCGVRELADRMAALGEAMDDRRMAHEMLITIALSYADVERFEESERVGTVAYEEAKTYGVHPQIHGVLARSAHMVPLGRIEALADVTSQLRELIEADGGQTCDFGARALLGHCLSLFESQAHDEATDALGFFDDSLPKTRTLIAVEQKSVELLLPFIGAEAARERFERIDTDKLLWGWGVGGGETIPTHPVNRIRAGIQLAAAERNWRELDQLTSEARREAKPRCAPMLEVLAGWSDAVKLAADGPNEAAIARVSESLETVGEPYTRARLAVDFLEHLPPDAATALRQSTARQLESMGARASRARLESSSHEA